MNKAEGGGSLKPLGKDARKMPGNAMGEWQLDGNGFQGKHGLEMREGSSAGALGSRVGGRVDKLQGTACFLARA